MNFFSKKNKKDQNNDNAKIQADLEKEIIVHNMPSQTKISGEILNQKSAGNVSLNQAGGESAKSFKMTGIVIVIVGLIFIALIVFLTYKFVIAPTAKETETNLQKKELSNPVVPEEDKEQEVISPESDVSLENREAEITEEEKNSQADDFSDEELMQEEFSGLNPVDLPPLEDSDEDGLYDEEENILGTNSLLKDSDEDGYEDLLEIKKGYNPTGDGLLAEAENISRLLNKENNFSFIYPSAWELNEVNNKLFTLDTGDGSLIQLSLMENYDKSGILNWYQDNSPGEEIIQDNFISKDSYEGVVSKNGFYCYLTNKAKDTIYIFSYTPASTERPGLINIFNLIYSSFQLEL